MAEFAPVSQPRVQLRDFLTGRDREIRRYSAGFLKLEEGDTEGTEHLCKSLIKDYKAQCKMYMVNISKDAEQSIYSSLTSFTKAVVKFTERIDRMNLSQAQTILKSARFLRLCVAGRAVYTDKCVKTRDVKHLFAENLYGRALVALNNKRTEAIMVASKGPQSASKKQPGKKKKKSGSRNKKTSGAKHDNLYELLSDVLDDLEEGVDGDGAECTKGAWEEEESETEEDQQAERVEQFPVQEEDSFEDLAAEEVYDLFLENEVRDMKDTVHAIMQSDHQTSIDETIWGDGDGKETRDYVYLQSFAHTPLPTKDVYDFVLRFPKNRMILHLLGYNVQHYLRDGQLQAHEVQDIFSVVCKYASEVKDGDVELLYLCITMMVRPKNRNTNVPTKEEMKEKMRFLKAMNRIDPLFVAYFSHFPDVMYGIFDTRRIMSQSDKMNHFMYIANMFGLVQVPSVEEIILHDEKFELHAFHQSAEAWGQTHREKPLSGVKVNYAPIFVHFRDDRMDMRRHPLYLPVEVLKDEETVELKIHYTGVSIYAKNLINSNGGKLEVFILSSHLVYFPVQGKKFETLGKCVTRMVDADDVSHDLIPFEVFPEYS